MPDVDSKVCTKCKLELPFSDYNKRKSGKYGLQAKCRTCIREQQANWRKKTAEKDPDYFRRQRKRNAATSRRWVEANRDRLNAQARERRAANPEGVREYLAGWRERNPDKIARYAERERAARKSDPEKYRQRAREYRARNLDRCREADRASYWRNRDRRLEKNRLWRELNPDYGEIHRKSRPEMYRETQRRRRARVRGSCVAEFSESELFSRMAYFGNKCWLCGGPFQEVDHVKPLSKGGAHMLSNLRPSCLKCNRSKGAKWPLEELNFK